MDEIKYSVVIPVYNSGDWLEELISKVEEVMNSLNGNFEIVMVNDCSPKIETWSVMCGLSDKYKELKIINLRYNSGQQNAVMCGLKHSRGEFVITMDDDFQHDPDDIKLLVSKMEESDTDVVIAQYDIKEHSLLRKLGSHLANEIYAGIYSKPKDVTSNSFRIMKRRLVETLIGYHGKFPQIGPMIFSLKPSIATVTIQHKKRKYGKSGYSLYRLISETFNIILNGSTFIIDFTAGLGVIISMCSFGLLIYYLMKYIFGGIGVPGYASTILLLTFFSGIIIFSIGATGKYIGKIVKETMGFPPYMEGEIRSGKERGDSEQ